MEKKKKKIFPVILFFLMIIVGQLLIVFIAFDAPEEAAAPSTEIDKIKGVVEIVNQSEGYIIVSQFKKSDFDIPVMKFTIKPDVEVFESIFFQKNGILYAQGETVLSSLENLEIGDLVEVSFSLGNFEFIAISLRHGNPFLPI